MRCFRLAALAGSLCLLPAYASPVTFSVSGSFLDGATLFGTVTIDTATGVALSGDLGVSGVAEDFTTLQSQSTGPQPSPIVTELDFTNTLASNNFLGLVFKPDSLVGYGGGPLCRYNSPNCIDPNNANLFFVTFYATNTAGVNTDTSVLAGGALTPVPEPPSIALTSAALLALAWKHRRLWFNRSTV